MSLKETNLYREIHAQPAALSLLLASEKENIQVLAQEIKKRNISYVVIAARGTSDNAGRYAQYVLGAHNGLMVALATPSLFSIYGQPPQLGNALVIGISQSGKSPDIVSVVAEARKQGALTAVLTNETASDLCNVLSRNPDVAFRIAQRKPVLFHVGALTSIDPCENKELILRIIQSSLWARNSLRVPSRATAAPHPSSRVGGCRHAASCRKPGPHLLA